MRIGGLAPPLLAPSVGPGAPSALSTFQRMSQYRLANQRLLDIRRAVLDVNKILGPNPLGIGAPAEGITLSGVNLGLDEVGVQSSLTSTAEVNADATSFDDRAPAWQTGSETTVRITLDGVYDGSAGDDELRFVVDHKKANESPSTLPSGIDVRIRVYDSNDDAIDDFQMKNESFPYDRTLSNGITLRIEIDGGDNALYDQDETVRVNLSASQGSALVRSNPFNGTGSDDAVLQDGFSVTNGSFKLNGNPIAVNANDSLDDVLDRINTAGLGVTATYDEATERVTLTNDAVGPAGISLTEDSSGLLAALKLGGAGATLGSDPEDIQPIGDLPTSFPGVINGTITINEQTVAVDPATDSLQDVLARLNAIDDVTASFQNGRVTLTGAPGVDLTVADDSGLLGVLDIATGSHEAIQGVEVGLSADSSRKVAKAMRRLALAVDAFVADQLPGPKMASGIQRLRSALATQFASVFEAEDGAFSALGGMRFDFSDTQSRGVSASLSNERRLVKLLDKGDEDTLVALLGDGDEEPGILERLDDFTRKNLAGIQETLGVGSLVDVRA